MPIILRRSEPINNVATGARSTVNLPADRALHSGFLVIEHTKSNSKVPMTIADMRTHIEEIKLVITDDATGTSTDIWEITGKNFLKLQAYYGLPQKAGILYLPFSQIYWDNPMEEAYFKLGTEDIRSVQLQVKFDSTVKNPVAEGFVYEYEYNEPLGRFIRLQENTVSTSVSGKLELTDLPIQGVGQGLKALHLTTNNISSLELRVNREVLYEDVKKMREILPTIKTFRTAGRKPQSGWTHMDFAGNQMRNVFDVSSWQDVRLIPDMTASGSFTVLSEMIVGHDVTVKG